MRRLLSTALLATLVAACGGADLGAGGDTTSTTTPPPTTVAPDEPVDSGGDEPITEPLPPGEVPNPRPPIDGSIDGEVWITGTDLLIMESFPIQVSLQVEGEKPTPCHEVFWTAEDTGEAIEITMISQVNADQSCAQVIEPFMIAVPLGSWADESRDVILNGENVGSFDS
jgi:hypothetical protein